MLAFIPFLLAPGYFLGWTLDLFYFRDASWTERLVLSTPLSIALSPILATVVGRFSSLSVVCWLFVLLTLCALFFTGLETSRKRAPANLKLSKDARVGLYILGAWTIVAIISLVDIQIGDRLYIPAVAFDQGVRSALAGGALRSGVPPANPFFYPGHAVALRYYYYWSVLCALPGKLFALSPRMTTLAGVVWSGIGLASLIPLYLKYFCEETIDLGKKSLIGVALLAVTGLDIIPTIVIFITQRTILADMEWWDLQQVTSWVDALLWVPHHVAALVACLAGFLVLWIVPRNAPIGTRSKAAIVAALAFASAAGLSVYVTLTFSIFLVIWTLVLLRSGLRAEALTFIVVGVSTVLISFGYLHDLRQPGLSGSLATFYVRSLGSIQEWADDFIPWNWAESLFLVLMLPIYYVIELGFFALVGFARARSYWTRTEPLLKWEWAAVCIGGVSLLVGSFLISTTGNNDLGFRGMMFAQFILLLWSVPMIHQWHRQVRSRHWSTKFVFQTFLWIGVIGTAYQLLELRLFTVFADHSEYVDDISWLPHTDSIGKDLYSARAGFEKLNQSLPANAIIQYSPINPAYVANVYYARHQTVDGINVCGTTFGGDPFECLQYQNKILTAFNGRTSLNLKSANLLCEELGIDVLIAERSDRMWAIKQSWVWSGKPIVANEYMRAIACGSRQKAIEDPFLLQSKR